MRVPRFSDRLLGGLHVGLGLFTGVGTLPMFLVFKFGDFERRFVQGFSPFDMGVYFRTIDWTAGAQVLVGLTGAAGGLALMRERKWGRWVCEFVGWSYAALFLGAGILWGWACLAPLRIEDADPGFKVAGIVMTVIGALFALGFFVAFGALGLAARRPPAKPPRAGAT